MNYLHLSALFAVPFLLLSCSTTPKFTSQFSNPEITPSGTANLESYMGQADAERHSVEGLAFYVTNDSDNLYLMVDFVSALYFQQAKEFGFTLYVDSPSNVKRSFGVTFPTGLYYELGHFPGAQSGYIEEPNWDNFPENQALMESAERNMTRQALISRRQSRSDNTQPTPIRLSQLQAQNLLIHFSDDDRSGRISFTIPLETRPTSQFSPDIQPGEEVDIGFEINPIRLFNLDSRGSVPLIASDPSGGRSQTQSEERQQQQERLMRIMRRIGGEPYEQWVKILIAEPE